MNRQNDVTRKTVVGLKEVQAKIPRNAAGDPAFEVLCWPDYDAEGKTGADVNKPDVLSVFTPSQVVAIVNRWIYQAEYQQESHRKRAEEHQRLQKPVKEAAKRLFPQTSFINLTPDQLEEAIREVVNSSSNKSKNTGETK